MTTKEILQEARRKIELGWCQGHYAMDAEGKPVRAADICTDKPTTYCLTGAVWSSGPRKEGELWPHYKTVAPAIEALRMAAPMGIGGPIGFNDAPGRTKQEVLAVIDRAMALVRIQESPRDAD